MRIPSRFWAALSAFALLLGTAPGCAQAAGMPQLDFANPLLIGQVVWGAVIFALFYFTLSRSALPRVERVLQRRHARIANDLDVARRARGDADRAVEELRRARHDAAAQAQANIDRVVQEARHAAELQTQEMNQRLAADIAKAEAQIKAARDEALSQLPVVASETAQFLLQKLVSPVGLEENVSPDEVLEAVRIGLSRQPV